MVRDRRPGDTALIGELVVLDLAEARDRVGEKWPLVSRHVHLLVENLLSRRLRGGSAFFRCGEGVFAIVFAGITREEAERECGQIGEDIMNYLFGQALAGLAGSEGDDGQQLAVHSEVFEIDLDQLQEAASPVEVIKSHVTRRMEGRSREQARSDSVNSVLAHVERKFEALVAKASEGRSPKLVLQLETLVSKLRALERSLYASRPIDRSGEEAHVHSTEWTPIQPMASPLERLSALIERTEAQLATFRVESEADGEAGKPNETLAGPDGDVEWLSLPEHKIDFVIDYLPLLDITAGVRGIYLNRIRFRIGGMSYDVKKLMEMEQDEEVFIIADRLGMRHLVQKIAEEGTESSPSVLVVTVHQTTLENLASRRVYVELASQLSLEQRRTIFFEVVLRENWKTGRLPVWLKQLQPYCRGFFIRFPAAALPHSSDLAGIEFASSRSKVGGAVGIDASDPGFASEEQRFHAMRRVAAMAEEAGIRSYVLNVEDARGITLCRAAAIRYLSSEKAMPALSQPGGIVAMSVDDIAGMNEAKAVAQR